MLKREERKASLHDKYMINFKMLTNNLYNNLKNENERLMTKPLKIISNRRFRE
jgi:hypothetical protein